MSGSIAPSGRFIYARYKTYERAIERLDDMCAEGEMTPAEARLERINDHRGRLLHWAVTIE